MQAFVQVRQKVNYMIKELRHDYYENKIEDNKNNFKVTWKILKQTIGQSTKSTCIDKIMYDCREIVDKQGLLIFITCILSLLEISSLRV